MMFLPSLERSGPRPMFGLPHRKKIATKSFPISHMYGRACESLNSKDTCSKPEDSRASTWMIVKPTFNKVMRRFVSTAYAFPYKKRQAAKMTFLGPQLSSIQSLDVSGLFNQTCFYKTAVHHPQVRARAVLSTFQREIFRDLAITLK